MASSQFVISDGTGTVILRVGEHKLKLSNVAYYSKATTNLISVSCLEDHHGLYLQAKERQLQTINKIVCIPFVRSPSSFVLCVFPPSLSGGVSSHVAGGDTQISGGASTLSGGDNSVSGGAYSAIPAAKTAAYTAHCSVSGGVVNAARAVKAAAPSTAQRPTYSQVLRQPFSHGPKVGSYHTHTHSSHV